MDRKFNVFYIAIILVGIALFFLLRPKEYAELSFYGFAESKETEINYNHSVVIAQIMVTPGQAVKEGDVLMHLFRQASKGVLLDQDFKINELEAEANIWQQKQRHQIAELQLDKQRKTSEVRLRIQQVEKELVFKQSLSQDLATIAPGEVSYKPLQDELDKLQAELQNQISTYDLAIQSLEKEARIGTSPYHAQINRLEAESAFEEAQLNQSITVLAPADGLIGNIYCKEEEHIPSYKTLLSFYEPHSGMIKGFVHEDLTLRVELGDDFKVASLKNGTQYYDGKVIGLGSRIVEIPTRLRKIPDVKSYGREVLVEITRDNVFLQNEKVSLAFIAPMANN